MSRRNQPYIPLYVQDFLTDEKLMECSASATGIYIRIMCIMHKSEQYGKIILKEQYKYNDKVYQNFARYLVRFMPYCIDEIAIGLAELVSTGVLQLDGDVLSQKRMVKDDELSTIRSSSGKAGNDIKWNKKSSFATAKPIAKPIANSIAKPIANAEYENENEIEDENESKDESKRKRYFKRTKKLFLNNTEYKLQFIEAKGITLEQLEKVMNDFIQSIELKGDYKKMPALKKHFFHYLNKIIQNETDKRNNQKPKFGSAVREAGSRMGSIGNSFGKEIA
jgi:hypothetical protein